MAGILFLDSPFHRKIWGGRKLRDEFGYDIPSEHTGEYWAISAHPNGVSKIKNGPFKGQKLDQLYAEHPELFGYPKSPVFPLLTKILDANDWLSVQVHPDDNYARIHEGELGKTECWYVIEADEGAEIIYGHQARSKEAFKKAIEEKQWDTLFTHVPVKKGDFFYVPSGTIHAIGKGVMVLETQQSSDTTYRVYDFDRKDQKGHYRTLHIQQSIDVVTIGNPQNTYPDCIQVGDLVITTLGATPFFTVYKWVIEGKTILKKSNDYTLVSVLNGSGKIQTNDHCYTIQKGDHFIISALVSEWTIEGEGLEMIASHANEQ